MSASATDAICAFIRNADLSGFPEKAVERAKKIIADSFAVILSGPNSELGPPMRGYLAGHPRGDALVIGTNISTTPQLAALANGAFAAALDYDDLLSPTHPSGIIVAALASVTGPDVPGRQFLEAYVVGLEVGAKIAGALGPGHSRRGYHATGTLGGFSAFAAIARLLGLSEDEIARGMGFVASGAGGTLCALGTMAKPMHSGFQARNAVDAVGFARAGMTSHPSTLETKRGFFAVYGDETSDASLIGPSLGNPWSILEPGPTLKKYPSCVAGHRAMAAVQALKALGLTKDNVENIECTVAPEALEPLMYPDPQNSLQAKFSMPYAIATALVDDRVAIASFETPALHRPDIRRLLKLISAREDPQQAVEDPVQANLSWGFRGYARVTAKLNDGRTLVSRVDLPPGHPSNELSWDDLEAKFVDCAANAAVDPPKAAECFSMLRSLDVVPSASSILRKLTV